MAFNSWTYFIFLALVLSAFYLAPPRGRKYILLVASYVFYGAWDWRFLGLILISTAIDFLAARQIELHRDDPRGRYFLWLSLVANLGILGFFKYYNFFIAGFAQLLGLDPDSVTLRIILPVGISFFTCQSMSYTIDVYRGKLAARRNFAEFALYVAFFPQLVVGPIIKAIDFFPQYDRWRAPTAALVQLGVFLIVLGLLKKAVLVDHLAYYSDAYFANPHAFPGMLSALAGTLIFSFQILFDFSGYSDIAIAIGTAALLGYRFSVTEFWRRWHISLSTWLRDYLYIPLGGNRLGVSRMYLNLLITMLLGGLWHGASWHFVVWGGLHGLYLVIHKLYHDLGWGESWRGVLGLSTRLLATHHARGGGGLGVFPRPHGKRRELGFAQCIWRPGAGRNPSGPLGDWPQPPGRDGVHCGEERWQLRDRLLAAHFLLRGLALALIVLSVFAVTDQSIAFIYFQF